MPETPSFDGTNSWHILPVEPVTFQSNSPPKPQIPQTPNPASPLGHSDFQEKALYLDSIGLDLDLFSLINHHPPIVSAPLTDLKSTVHFLTSMGFTPLEFRRLVGMCPEILASRVSDIVPVFTFLLREARVNSFDLKRELVLLSKKIQEKRKSGRRKRKGK